MHGIPPVSYTHLDVYKRQDKDNRDSFIEVIDKRMEYLPKSQINRLQKLKKALGNLG